MSFISPKSMKFFYGSEGFRTSTDPDEKAKENEEVMLGLKSVDIRMRVDEIVTATIDLIDISDLPLSGIRPIFVIRHPVTGSSIEVSSINFADGTTWEKK